MKDLIGLHTALPDRDDHGIMNIRKMSILSGIFRVSEVLVYCKKIKQNLNYLILQELSELQKMRYPMEISRDLINTMRVSLYLYYSEEEIYKLSLQREPKDPKLSSSGVGCYVI